MEFQKRVNDYMEREGLDALVASSPESVFYSSGCYLITQRTIPDRLAFTVYPRGSSPMFLVCNLEESNAKVYSNIRDIRTYVEFEEDPIKSLARNLRSVKMAKGNIGVEIKHLNHQSYRNLSKLLPEATLTSADDFFTQTRVVKTPREVEILEYAAHVTIKVICDTLEKVRPGNTELTIAEALASGVIRGGAGLIPFMVVSTGPLSLTIHRHPEDRRVEKGEMIFIDLGGLFNGYNSDLVRMGCAGEPDEYQLKACRTVYRGRQAMIEATKPGVKVSDLFKICEQTIKSQGFDFGMPHAGHGLGIRAHEEPLIHPYNRMELEEGMVFCIEPRMRGRDARYHIEDTLLVEHDGVRVLSGDLEEDEYPIIAEAFLA